MDNQLTLWDVAFLPSLLLFGGVTPDHGVVVRIPAEVVFAHFFVLVFAGTLFRPVLTIFSRLCLVHLALVVFAIICLTILGKRGQIIGNVVNEAKHSDRNVDNDLYKTPN